MKNKLGAVSLFIIIIFITLLSLSSSSLTLADVPGSTCTEDASCASRIYGAGQQTDDNYETHEHGIEIREQEGICQWGQCQLRSDHQPDVLDCSARNEERCGTEVNDFGPKRSFYDSYSVEPPGEAYSSGAETLCCGLISSLKKDCEDYGGDRSFCEMDGDEAVCRSKPTTYDLEVDEPDELDYCSTTPPGVTLRWEFDSQTNDEHGGTHLEVSRNASFTDIIIDPYVEWPMQNYPIDPTDPDYGPDYDFDQTYYWRVKVIDEHGKESEWSNIQSFTVGSQRADAHFTFTPRYPFEEELVYFSNETVEGPNYNISGYEWEFENGQPSESSDENPNAYFETEGRNTVTMKVIEDGFSEYCYHERDVRIRPELPEFIEVDPFR